MTYAYFVNDEIKFFIESDQELTNEELQNYSSEQEAGEWKKQVQPELFDHEEEKLLQESIYENVL